MPQRDVVLSGENVDPMAGDFVYRLLSRDRREGVLQESAAGNKARYGGGIWNGGALTLSKSTVNGNRAGAAGGGISNEGGTVTLTNANVSENWAELEGGGIHKFAGTLKMTNVTVNDNIAGSIPVIGVVARGSGGGIFNRATLTMTDSTVSGNSAGVSGGGITSLGTGSVVDITNSTVSDNMASDDGGDLVVFPEVARGWDLGMH